jgi:hypothetical protein
LVMVPANLARAADSVPVPDDGVIASPGSYHLAKDLSVDRSTGIEIKADRVTLDLRGRALRFTGTPKPGVLGITASGRSDVRITNGAVGGFWFNVQCTQTDRLRIHNVRFDDIPYLAVNVGRSRGVVISDNEFSNFRYDLEKPKGSTYVIGVNLSSDDVVVTNNRFTAQPPAGTGPKLALETVFVLFRPSKNCVVAHNEMIASELLHRGYGIWVATDASATIVYNRVRNTQYGVCVAGDGSATVGHNTFAIDETKDGGTTMDTYGLAATAPKQIAEIGNSFTGFKIPTAIGKPTTAPTTTPK